MRFLTLDSLYVFDKGYVWSNYGFVSENWYNFGATPMFPIAKVYHEGVWYAWTQQII